MIRGYRWVETGKRYWQLEGPAGSRRFHGAVFENFCYVSGRIVHGWYVKSGGPSGETATRKEAIECVEQFVLAATHGKTPISFPRSKR